MNTELVDGSATLSDFGTRLLADKTGELCAEYRRTLEQAIATGRDQLRRPLEREEYETTKALVDSAMVAVEVVQQIWDQMHLSSLR